MTTNQAVGEAVHSYMWRKRISQESLATALGITQAAVSKKVRGKRPFSIDELLEVSVVLDTPLSQILAGVRGYGCSANPVGQSRSMRPVRFIQTAVAA